MKTTLTTDEAVNRLLADSNARWTRAGAFALVEYLEALEADLQEELEFDLVAIRCDYSEYPSLEAWAEEYFPEGLKDVHAPEDLRAYIDSMGTLIEFDGGVIVSVF